MNNNKERKCLCSIADVKPSTRQRNARLRQPTPHARNRTLLPRLNIKPKATPPHGGFCLPVTNPCIKTFCKKSQYCLPPRPFENICFRRSLSAFRLNHARGCNASKTAYAAKYIHQRTQATLAF